MIRRPGIFAGLAILPTKSALTGYSYRLSHDHQRAFLAALDAKMTGAGLAAGEEAIFDLDLCRTNCVEIRVNTAQVSTAWS